MRVPNRCRRTRLFRRVSAPVRLLFRPLRRPVSTVIWLLSASVLLAGSDWGLPSTERSRILLDGGTLTPERSQRMSETREARRAGKHAHSRVRERKPGVLLDETERLDALCRFSIHSSAADEEKTYSALSAIDPSRLRFTPGYILYGGAYLYPIGAALAIEEKLGFFCVTRNYAHYLDHPEEMARVYRTGRLMNVFAFLMILLLLADLGERLHSPRAGALSMASFALSTCALDQSLVSKSHVWAAFWGMAGLFFLLRHREKGGFRPLLLSAVAFGWSAGSSPPALALLVFIPLLGKTAARRIAAALFTALAVFLLFNPFLVYDPSSYLHFADKHLSGWGCGYGVFSFRKCARFLRDFIFRANCFPASLVGLATIVAVLLRGPPPLRRLAAGTLGILLAAGASICVLRINLFIGPFFALFSGVGAAALLGRVRQGGATVSVLLLSLLFALGLGSAVLFAWEVIDDREWLAPTRAWIEETEWRDSTTIGFFGYPFEGRPDPRDTPPLPLLRGRWLNLSAWSEGDPVPDAAVIGVYGDNPLRWERHPLRSRFRLARVLGHRRAFDLLPAWRVPSQARITGSVYVLNKNPE
ncbi:MAG: hypothetical protein JW958_07445 [Candidatus Eisenbacteria bacterium]|nr:hypothetical protein [Candidatus Eisenbacteria bacterium]